MESESLSKAEALRMLVSARNYLMRQAHAATRWERERLRWAVRIIEQCGKMLLFWDGKEAGCGTESRTPAATTDKP